MTNTHMTNTLACVAFPSLPFPYPLIPLFLLSSQFSRRTRAETLATQATNTPIYLGTEILLPSDFSIPLVTIHYIHHCTSPIIHPVCTPKFSITFVFNEKLKAMLMHNLGAGGGGIRCITMVRMTNKNKEQGYWNYHKTQHIERKQKHTETNPAFSTVLLFNRNSQAVITPSL